jgi:hypothetical protein
MRADNLYFMVEGITHGKRSKNSRIQGLQPLVKAGLLVFRAHHRLLVTELCAFPLAAHDDLGDALSMQLPMWAITRSRAEELKGDPTKDPLTFDSAAAELHGRPEGWKDVSHAYSRITNN